MAGIKAVQSKVALPGTVRADRDLGADDAAVTVGAFPPDGLFITGDRACLGDDSFPYFAERTKVVLKIDGESINVTEIERVIAVVPDVAEVAVLEKVAKLELRAVLELES